jgi:hypothetical protein
MPNPVNLIFSDIYDDKTKQIRSMITIVKNTNMDENTTSTSTTTNTTRTINMSPEENDGLLGLLELNHHQLAAATTTTNTTNTTITITNNGTPKDRDISTSQRPSKINTVSSIASGSRSKNYFKKQQQEMRAGMLDKAVEMYEQAINR